MMRGSRYRLLADMHLMNITNIRLVPTPLYRLKSFLYKSILREVRRLRVTPILFTLYIFLGSMLGFCSFFLMTLNH
jgi:hypothetical protein